MKAISPPGARLPLTVLPLSLRSLVHLKRDRVERPCPVPLPSGLVVCRRPVNSPPQAGLKRHPWPG